MKKKKKLIAFPWYGGKFCSLKELLPIINNTSHITYVEPFGGSASLLLNKEPSKVEVYNDIYSEVVNFFKVLRNQKEELLSLLHLTPYSRKEFKNACLCSEEDSDLEKARKFFIKARQVRNGQASLAVSSKWSYSIECSRRSMASSVSKWLNSIDKLEYVYLRLKTVQIENKNALDIISRYDSKNTLHYLDPPYLIDTRTGGIGYSFEFDENQHIELLNLIRDLEGKVILSGYENSLYSDMLVDWNEHKFAPKRVSSSVRNNQSSIKQEIIWTNYDIENNNDLIFGE